MFATLLIGIDVGTLSSKGVLVTPSGQVLARHQVDAASRSRPGWAQHDAHRA